MQSALLISQDLQPAGAQRQCVELALGLRQSAGWEVEVIVLEPGGPLTLELEAAGLPVHICPRTWRWDFSPARGIASAAHRGRHDIIHSFLFLPNFYARLAGLKCRYPAIVSSLRSSGAEGWHRYLAEIAMAPLCDVIIVNSEAGRKHIEAFGVKPAKLALVRNGLNLDRFVCQRPVPPLTPRSPGPLTTCPRLASLAPSGGGMEWGC